MRATVMYGAGNVRMETLPDPVLQEPTDAVVRVVRACVCGTDLHPYHSMPASAEGSPMGHEFLGVVEEIGTEVSGLKKGDMVVSPFAYADNTCEFCREVCTPRARTAGSSLALRPRRFGCRRRRAPSCRSRSVRTRRCCRRC
jgi:threonine dehydrogenase-like Zn-dependent dehydrogenase